MKNLLLLFVAACVLLILGGTGWLLLSDSHEPSATGPAREELAGSSASSAQVTAPDAEPEADEDSSSGELAARTTAQGEGRESLSATAQQETRKLHGTVRIPFGAPADPSLTVFALEREVEYDNFLEDWTDASAEERESDPLGQGKVSADGSFELEIPEGRRRVWLLAAGKFLYSPQAQLAEVETAEGLVLETKLGAAVVGSFEASGVTSPDPKLAHVRLKLGIEITALEGKPDDRETISLEFDCEPDGTFELRGLPIAFTWKLEIIPEHYAARTLLIEGLKPGENRQLAIALDSGGQIRGRVLDPDGEPIGNAKVNALLIGASFGFDDERVGWTETNDQGEFELSNMPVGGMALKADHADFLESKRVNVQVELDTLTAGIEITLARGRSLSGLVSWPDGTPAKGATVNVEFDQAYMAGLSAFNSLRGAEAETETDESGRFALAGMGSGPFVVAVRARPRDLEPTPEGEPEDYSTWFTARVESVQPGSELELLLHGPLGLAGRVVDSKKNAIPKFVVHAIRRAQGSFGPVGMEDRKDAFDAEDGSFLLSDLTPGDWELTVEAEGFVSLAPLAINVPTEEPVLLQVVPAASIAGRVLTPAGVPVSGATVEVAGGEVAFQDAMRTIDGRPKVRSDSGGYFLFEQLPPGSTALLAKHDDYCESLPEAFELVAGAKFEDADLRLREGGRLTGLVYDKAGEFAAGYLIAISTADMRQIFSTTDSRGEFVAEHVPPGPWTVVALNTGADLSADADGTYGGAMGSMLISQAEIVDGETTHVVIGAPPADPVKITGKVSHDDEPYPGASLIFFRQGTKLYENMKFAVFDEDGTYSVVVDGPGSYVVYLQKMGRTQLQQQNVEFAIDVPSVQEYVHDFEVPLGRISGRVTNSKGQAASGARVTIATDGGFRSDVLMGGQYSEVQTDANGNFDLIGLRPGTYMIAAGGAMMLDVSGTSGNQVGRVTRGGIRLAENEWKQGFDFQLPAPGALEVSVVGIDGLPVKDASVFLRDADGRPIEPFSFTATQATGICSMRGLAPGDYTVVARKKLASSQESEPFRIVAGETAKLQLRLEEGTILWIKLKDSDGEDVRASVSVVDANTGKDWAAFFGMEDLQVIYMDGGFSPTEHRLGPLPAGKYRIQATGASGSKSKPVTLHGEPERKITLRLK